MIGLLIIIIPDNNLFLSIRLLIAGYTGGVHIAAAVGGGAGGEEADVRVAFGGEEGLEGDVIQGVGDPGGDGLVDIVFDDEESVGGGEVWAELVEESAFVPDVVKSIGHEDAVEWDVWRGGALCGSRCDAAD